jgi:hypothetical protein
MLVRTCSVLFGFVLVACGGSDPEEQGPSEGAMGAAPSERTDDPAGLHLTLAGDGAELSGGARLEVREQNPIVNLVVTAVYDDNTSNLVQFQVALMGVENAMGFHRMDLGAPGTNAAAFANAYLEQQSYSSRAGLVELTLAGDGSIAGSLEAELFQDSVPGVLDESGASFSLSGSFDGFWSLVCRSPVPGLPGDHSVADSAYCNGLRF